MSVIKIMFTQQFYTKKVVAQNLPLQKVGKWEISYFAAAED